MYIKCHWNLSYRLAAARDDLRLLLVFSSPSLIIISESTYCYLALLLQSVSPIQQQIACDKESSTTNGGREKRNNHLLPLQKAASRIRNKLPLNLTKLIHILMRRSVGRLYSVTSRLCDSWGWFRKINLIIAVSVSPLSVVSFLHQCLCSNPIHMWVNTVNRPAYLRSQTLHSPSTTSAECNQEQECCSALHYVSRSTACHCLSDAGKSVK